MGFFDKYSKKDLELTYEGLKDIPRLAWLYPDE